MLSHCRRSLLYDTRGALDSLRRPSIAIRPGVGSCCFHDDTTIAPVALTGCEMGTGDMPVPISLTPCDYFLSSTIS